MSLASPELGTSGVDIYKGSPYIDTSIIHCNRCKTGIQPLSLSMNGVQPDITRSNYGYLALQGKANISGLAIHVDNDLTQLSHRHNQDMTKTNPM